MERRIKSGIISVVVVAILVIMVTFNHSGEIHGRAKIIISLNYGTDIILDRFIPSGISALDALKSVANVTTSYGGAFVSGINGIMRDESRKMDWFYYINGILANVGASQYILHNGDTLRWDYHYWGRQMFINAEIEDFPEPIAHGYNGRAYTTIIAYGEGYRDIADILYSHWKWGNVEMESVEDLVNYSEKNLIVIGANNSLFREINGMHEKLGFFYYMDNGIVKDVNGDAYVGGFAEITQSPYNPKGTMVCENVLIFISGNSQISIKNCVEDLISGNIDRFWCFEGEKI